MTNRYSDFTEDEAFIEAFIEALVQRHSLEGTPWDLYQPDPPMSVYNETRSLAD